MKRVHATIRQSSELVFVDSSGGVDRFNCRVFLFMTHSCAGGLPLGCLITTSESREIISCGIELWKTILPHNCFYGRGTQGPHVFLTDDCCPERQAIHSSFPESVLLLCIFHILQAMWRFLWDAKNKIPKENRPHLLGLLKSLVYADSVKKLEELYGSARNDEIAKKSPNYLQHLENIYERRELWAICLRDQLPIRNNNMTNFVES